MNFTWRIWGRRSTRACNECCPRSDTKAKPCSSYESRSIALFFFLNRKINQNWLISERLCWIDMVTDREWRSSLGRPFRKSVDQPVWCERIAGRSYAWKCCLFWHHRDPPVQKCHRRRDPRRRDSGTYSSSPSVSVYRIKSVQEYRSSSGSSGRLCWFIDGCLWMAVASQRSFDGTQRQEQEQVERWTKKRNELNCYLARDVFYELVEAFDLGLAEQGTVVVVFGKAVVSTALQVQRDQIHSVRLFGLLEQEIRQLETNGKRFISTARATCWRRRALEKQREGDKES